MASGEYTYRTGAAEGCIVEIYLPKRLRYLSGAYALFREELESDNTLPPRLYGFSIYDVEGAFRGRKRTTGRIDDELTMVIRVFFDNRDLQATPPEESREGHDFDSPLERKVYYLLDKLAEIVQAREKELWAMCLGARVYKKVRKRT